MKEHPDGKPRCAETVDGCNNDDCDGNQQFESKRIDGRTSTQ